MFRSINLYDDKILSDIRSLIGQTTPIVTVTENAEMTLMYWYISERIKVQIRQSRLYKPN